VNMHTRKHTNANAHAHIHTHTYTHRHTHTHMYLCTHTYAHKNTYTHICIRTYAHTHKHTHTLTNTHTHPHTQTQTHSRKENILTHDTESRGSCGSKGAPPGLEYTADRKEPRIRLSRACRCACRKGDVPFPLPFSALSKLASALSKLFSALPCFSLLLILLVPLNFVCTMVVVVNLEGAYARYLCHAQITSDTNGPEGVPTGDAGVRFADYPLGATAHHSSPLPPTTLPDSLHSFTPTLYPPSAHHLSR
jgi:hypothetical protein